MRRNSAIGVGIVKLSAIQASLAAVRLKGWIFIACLVAPWPAAAEGVFAGMTARSEPLQGAAVRVEEELQRVLGPRGWDTVRRAISPHAHGTLSLEDLGRLRDDARGRYLDGAFDAAVQRASDGVHRFENSFAYTTNADAWRYYADLLVVQALAFDRLGQTDRANKALTLLAAQRSAYVLDPGLVPPEQMARYDRIKKRVLGQGRAHVTLVSQPGGATVIVDGEEKGQTPLDMKTLPPGPHYITMKLDESRFDRLLVLHDGEQRITAELGDIRAPLAKRLRAAVEAGESRSEIANAAGAIHNDVVVGFLQSSGDAIDIILCRVRDGNLTTVVGARLPQDLVGLERAVAKLSVAVESTDTDRWIGDVNDTKTPRAHLLQGTMGPAKSGAGLTAVLGAGFALVGVVAIGAVIGGVVAYALRPPNPGGTDIVVDGTGLASQ